VPVIGRNDHGRLFLSAKIAKSHLAGHNSRS
jgi:hypothetical protein